MGRACYLKVTTLPWMSRYYPNLSAKPVVFSR